MARRGVVRLSKLSKSTIAYALSLLQIKILLMLFFTRLIEFRLFWKGLIFIAPGSQAVALCLVKCPNALAIVINLLLKHFSTLIMSTSHGLSNGVVVKPAKPLPLLCFLIFIKPQQRWFYFACAPRDDAMYKWPIKWTAWAFVHFFICRNSHVQLPDLFHLRCIYRWKIGDPTPWR